MTGGPPRQKTRPAGVLAAAVLVFYGPAIRARAQVEVSVSSDVVARSVTEAAQRFGLPEHWIRAVIRAESAFNSRATSHVGAMGLMQVMPATYAELRARYGLGPDAYDPRDNVLAGSAYLRELYDRFGPAGFLAAYNAGPGRYLEHLRTGQTLPIETRIYVDRVAAGLGGDGVRRAQEPQKDALGPKLADPAAASIFVSLGGPNATVVRAAGAPEADLFPRAGRSGPGHE